MAEKEIQTYVERNAGKLKTYRVTSVYAKHWRNERDGNQIVPVLYSAHGLGGRTSIQLTPAGAATLTHLGLVEIGETVNTTAPTIRIPADWQEMSLQEKKNLIAQFKIDGAKTGTHARCNEIIAAYIEARK